MNARKVARARPAPREVVGAVGPRNLTRNADPRLHRPAHLEEMTR